MVATALAYPMDDERGPREHAGEVLTVPVSGWRGVDAAPAPLVLGASRERRKLRLPPKAPRRVYLWRRALVVTIIAVLGGIAWDAAQHLLVAAGAPVGGVCRPLSASSGALGLAAPDQSPGAASVLGPCPGTYVAKQGDTVWGIALRYSKGADPRALADVLEGELGGATLQPGQALAVP